MRLPKILTTLRSYSWPLFAADTMAGTTVAMVAVPLAIAIAIASGATPAQGLVTAIIGGFLVSLLGGSRFQIGGPTGAFIVVVYGVIAEHGYDGLVTATFMAGLILLVAGWLRAGRLIAHIPEAVVHGFTIGIAIIIASSQLKDLFGLANTDLPADFLDKIPVLWAARETLSLPALAIALGTIAMIIGLRRLSPKIPGLILAMAASAAAVALLQLPVDTIASRYGVLPAALPAPHLPNLQLASLPELLPSALVIAFLAGVESLLSAIVADRMTDGHHRPNAELLAQGSANIASALFGGLPVTGAIARTSTNVAAGAKTPVAGIVHALVVLLVMLVAARLAGWLAMPALAGLLLLTAWNMSEPRKWASHARAPIGDRAVLLLTMVLTVIADLTVAIAAGAVLGLLLRRYRSAEPPDQWSTPKR